MSLGAFLQGVIQADREIRDRKAEEQARKDRREEILLQIKARRDEALLGHVLQARAAAAEKAQAVSSIISTGTAMLGGDRDAAELLWRSGQLENIIEIIEKRTLDNTLDPDFVPTLVNVVREQQKQRQGELTGEELAKGLSAGLATGIDLNDPGGQKAALSMVLTRDMTTEELEQQAVEAYRAVGNNYGAGTAAPFDIGNVNPEKVDTAEYARRRDIVTKGIGNLISRWATVGTDANGRPVVTMTNPKDESSSQYVDGVINRATSRYSELIDDTAMDPNKALDLITQHMREGIQRQAGLQDLYESLPLFDFNAPGEYEWKQPATDSNMSVGLDTQDATGDIFEQFGRENGVLR